ncbi:MAG TPA: hypothetical protein PKH79_02110 [Prolixibacteraceae bacterium]|nr:hypothetical protein [Prolixibacteraceae bacterium]HPS11789.1 hypothetical protein [Prolixibacteraceae bacterium]
MKRIIYLFAAICIALVTLFSCAPEEIEGIDQSGLPVMSEMQITITVSDVANSTSKLVTFHMDGEAVPIWIISSSKTVTGNDTQITYKKAGNYSVEVKAYNRNGVSDGSVVKDFVIQ